MSTESLARVGHCGQKRERPAPFVHFDNELSSSSDEGVESGYDDESTSDWKNGPRRKKPKIEPSPLTTTPAGDSTENGHASKKSKVTPSSPAVCTPTTTKEKRSYRSETSSPLTITPGESTGTPSTTRSGRKFRRHSSATPSSDNKHSSDSRKEGDDHDETHQEGLIARKKLFVGETSEEIFGCLQRDQAQPKLVERLKQLAEVGPKYEIDLELADLLEKLSSSNPRLQNVAKKAREASMQQQNGVKLMTQVRELLRAAFTDVPTSAE